MSTRGKIGVGGLNTAANWLTLEPGELIEAENCTIDSRGLIRPRRGQMLQSEYATGVNGYIDGDSTDANLYRARELYQWGSTLMVYYGTALAGSKLASFENWATAPIRALVGSYAEPEPTLLRMKFAQLAQSLYWTTSGGLYVLDVVGGTARRAGVFAPENFYWIDSAGNGTRLASNPDASGTWFAKNKAVAGRGCIGHKDSNDVVHISKAGDRFVVINPNDVTVAIGSLVRNANVVTATVSSHNFQKGDIVNLTLTGGDVGNFNTTNNTITSVTATTIVWAETAANYTNVAQVTISSGTKTIQWVLFIPPNLSTSHFVQLYRTEESATAATDPGDEMFLAYERYLTATDISNGYVTIQDTTPSSRLGAALDSNANSGEGLLGVHETPPLCRDICTWDSRLWGAETTDHHRLQLRMLGTGSPNGIQTGDVIVLDTRAYVAGTDFTLTTEFTPERNVQRTLHSLASNFNLGTTNDGKTFRILMSSDSDETWGKFMIEEDAVGGSAMYAACDRAAAFAEPLPTVKAVTEASSSRTSNVVTITTGSAHGLSAGQDVMLATSFADANFPAGVKTILTVPSATTFTYAEAGSNANPMTGTYFVCATTFKSDNNKQPVRFSEQGLPESWPLPNALGGLPDGAEVLRIAPSGTGGSLLVFLKDSSIYRVSGAYPYVVTRLDDTATLVAADSLVAHAGKLHGLTTQGICTITEVGVGVVGGDVEDAARLIAARIGQGSLDSAVAFGTTYESDRQYLLSCPREEQLHPGVLSSTVTQALAFQSMQGKYARPVWERNCGIVFRGPDVLVMGDANTNQLRIERKSLTYTDYADESVSVVVNGTQSSVSTITVDSSNDLDSGDAIEIGGAFYRVTGATSTSITIDGTVSVTDNDVLTGYVAIPVTVVFAPDTGGAPGIEKRWREVQLHFGRQCVDTLTVTFANERGATASVTSRNADYEFGAIEAPTRRIAVPQTVQMGTSLFVAIQSDEALSYFTLLGVSATSEAVSERTGK